MRPLVNFSGINFLPQYAKLAPDFCNNVNSNLNFTSSGCIFWVGARRKYWIDPYHYVERPIFRHGGTAQNLLHLINIFCGSSLRCGKSEKFSTRCNDPNCVNPEHFIVTNVVAPLEVLYPDFVREDKFYHREYYKFYAILKDYGYGIEFRNIHELSEYLGINPRMANKYIYTQRLLGGQWRLFKDRVLVNYLDMELFELNQGEINGKESDY